MRKILIISFLLLCPLTASAQQEDPRMLAADHDFRATPIPSTVPGSSEVLIVDGKTGEIYEYMESTSGTPPTGGVWIRYIGKLHPGQKFGDLIVDRNTIVPAPPGTPQ